MGLSHELLSQFAKLVKDDKKKSSESTVYGTVVTDGNGNKYVKLDGSDQLTPLTDDERPSVDSTTTSANEGERVSVLIKDHTATVTGNISSPAVRTGDFDDLSDQVEEIKQFDIVIADRVQANEAYIVKLRTDKANVGDLTAATARITELEAKDVEIEGQLTAAEADIENLQATKIDTDVVNAQFATIESLDATTAEITELVATKASVEDLNAATAEITELVATKASVADLNAATADIDSLEATTAEITELVATKASVADLNAAKADIEDLEANKLSATDANLTYATIDFTNITGAAVEKLFTDSGIIEDLVVSEGHITGELVGVTIKGDLIEAGTVKADKLVVKGSDGLFYKLNTDGISTTAEQTEYNSLSGSVITANSITAEKIAVDDLVAFDATIGGFNITENAIYSGVKESPTNTTRGVYLDKDGQVAFGDSNNFIRYYKDQNGNYKLEISANSVSIRSGSSGESTSLDTVIDEIKNDVDSLRDEITTLLRIESSRGTVFKNDTVATVLSVVIYHGTQRITDSTTMKTVFGNSAYLQWKWQRLDDSSFGVISASDTRFGDNGFTFTLSPEDVDTKVTFMCELIV